MWKNLRTFKYEVLCQYSAFEYRLSFRYGDINRSGDDYQWRVCYSQMPRKVHATLRGGDGWGRGHTGRHQGSSGGRGNEGKTWAKAFIVVSVGRNM